MSHVRLLYHIVFRTQHGRKSITEEYERELYQYFLDTIDKNKKCKLYRIGGTEDHVHFLVGIRTNITLKRFLRDVQFESARWLRGNPRFPRFENWAFDFACFTCNPGDKEVLIEVIKNQKQHHETVSFEEEYCQLLAENDFKIDENYFLGSRPYSAPQEDANMGTRTGCLIES